MGMYAGIEAGGTKFVCGIGSGPANLLARTTIPTTTPEETIQNTVNFIQTQIKAHGKLSGIGIASFGPLDPDPGSPTYGYITSTPKPGWSNFDFAGSIRRSMDVPIGFDTDVNGAALGEWRWGAAQGLDTFIYLTIGTGIGGGGMINGRLMHGLVHPEMGHIHIPHDHLVDPFPGVCPFHKDCLEGLATGPAMHKRWGQPPDTLPPDHPAWALEAHYLALALANFILTLSPQRIILGGGIMHQEHLIQLIRDEVQTTLNNYVQSPQILDNIHEYIVPPALGDRAGVLGGIALAIEAENKRSFLCTTRHAQPPPET